MEGRPSASGGGAGVVASLISAGVSTAGAGVAVAIGTGAAASAGARSRVARAPRHWRRSPARRGRRRRGGGVRRAARTVIHAVRVTPAFAGVPFGACGCHTSAGFPWGGFVSATESQHTAAGPDLGSGVLVLGQPGLGAVLDVLRVVRMLRVRGHGVARADLLDELEAKSAAAVPDALRGERARPRHGER
jgi:hypothetical protein